MFFSNVSSKLLCTGFLAFSSLCFCPSGYSEIHGSPTSFYYLPEDHHFLTGVSAHLDSLEIEDGSVWKINNKGKLNLAYWKNNDPLVITQNFAVFSRYKFKIVNKALNETILASLLLGPCIDNELSHFIVYIDYYRRQIMLEDNSFWQISEMDWNTFTDWDLDDGIIIGSNGNCLSTMKNILINVNMNNFVKARPI